MQTHGGWDLEHSEEEHRQRSEQSIHAGHHERTPQRSSGLMDGIFYLKIKSLKKYFDIILKMLKTIAC